MCLRRLARRIAWHRQFVSVSAVDGGSGILFFVHHLLSICSRIGTLLGAQKTVIKDKVCALKQLLINRERGRDRQRQREIDNYSDVHAVKQQCQVTLRKGERAFPSPGAPLWQCNLFHSLTLGLLLETKR